MKTIPFKSRTPMKTTPKKKPPRNASSQSLEGYSPVELAQGINNLLEELGKKGVEVADWDNKGRKLRQLILIRGELYFMATDDGGGMN